MHKTEYESEKKKISNQTMQNDSLHVPMSIWINIKILHTHTPFRASFLKNIQNSFFFSSSSYIHYVAGPLLVHSNFSYLTS